MLPEQPRARGLHQGNDSRVPQPPLGGEHVEALADARQLREQLQAVLAPQLRLDHGRRREQPAAADVVTLDSWARLLDLDADRETLVSPVMPSRANADAGRLSVLAPLGMAVLGFRAGDTIDWPVPGGRRRLRVLDVMFQPEAFARRRRREPRRLRSRLTSQ